MNVRTVPVEEVAAVFNGKTPSKAEQRNSGHPVLKIKDVDENGRFIGRFDSFVDLDFAEGLLEKMVQSGDTLILNAAHNAEYVASKSFFAHGSAVGAIATGEWLVLRPVAKRANARFLFYWSQHAETRKKLGSLVKGIHLYPKDVAELPISLPELSEQERIAELLEQADRLRCTRRYALDLSATFLPAAFLELFGDPRKTTTRWETEQLENLGTLDRGRSKHRPRNAPHLYGGRYPFIQTGDVANAEGYVRDHSQSYSEDGLKQSKLWAAGTLCITIAANIGKTAILTYPACFPDSIVGFVPGERVKVEFVQFWLSFLQDTLEKTAPEVAQKNINLEILRDLRCPVPPVSLQQKFVALEQRHEQLRAGLRESLRQAEHVFQSLLEKAFAQP